MVKSSERRQAFGARLRQLRESRGLSTYALADVLRERGTPRTGAAISEWERGTYAPQADVVGTLEVALEAPGELLPLLGLTGPSIDRLGALDAKVAELNAAQAALKSTLAEVQETLVSLLHRIEQPTPPEVQRRRPRQAP